MTLPADLSMGALTLLVGNLDEVTRFYTDGVGLKIISLVGPVAILGKGDEPVLILEQSSQLKHAEPQQAGLFHTAFLFDTRADLAQAVASVVTKYPRQFTGSADHLVSEAFYFNDPEGNGVELYWDRDRTEWIWQHGQIAMDTLQLDPSEWMRENHIADTPLKSSRIGHVHLSVGQIDQAKDFYADKLGFDVTLNWGGTALFVSAGGYHHHMAMNVWRSRGASMRQASLGLGQVSINLPNRDSILSVVERLTDFGVQTADDGQNVKIADPWGNTVSLVSSGLRLG